MRACTTWTPIRCFLFDQFPRYQFRILLQLELTPVAHVVTMNASALRTCEMARRDTGGWANHYRPANMVSGTYGKDVRAAFPFYVGALYVAARVVLTVYLIFDDILPC
jgi:hypothetical protein